METIILKVYEAINLEAEILDILKLKAPIKLKFTLTDLLLKTQYSLAAAKQLLSALFEKYGEIDESNPAISILPQFIEGTSKKTDSFLEYEAINNCEIEIQYKYIDLDLFENIESDNNYPILFRLIK
ncbi:hypothetical protein [Mucilaginibacter segetis]|uniref:Uncharacterized protein n=1 Tax=Mucilaginibacter segetis TaxID=2793071 RepID=A0A934PXF5_9SPHI|nr:hypothetical protein [Mucilaginibacter segetis]MBK0380930.1 hypothetical protein [Mucilaginibacter segetis]